jgi:hypothetical protein
LNLELAEGEALRWMQLELQTAVAQKLDLSEQLEAAKQLAAELEAAKSESSQRMQKE